MPKRGTRWRPPSARWTGCCGGNGSACRNGTTLQVHWVAYYDMYRYPEELPPYALGFLDFWWVDPDRPKAGACATAVRSDTSAWAPISSDGCLLMIPTLLGIMVINFTLVQFVPGGPIDQIIAAAGGRRRRLRRHLRRRRQRRAATGSGRRSAATRAPRGLPETRFLRSRAGGAVQLLSRIVCADGFEGEPDLDAEECTAERIPAVERFFLMMWDYLRFDFGESFFHSESVVELVIDKMPVSITLGPLVDADRLPRLDPAWHPQGGARRQPRSTPSPAA